MPCGQGSSYLFLGNISCTETLGQSLVSQAEAPRDLLWGRKTSWASPLVLCACSFLFCVLFCLFVLAMHPEDEVREDLLALVKRHFSGDKPPEDTGATVHTLPPPLLKQKTLEGRSSAWYRKKVSDSKTERQEQPHRQNCVLYHLLAVTLLGHSPSVWVETTLPHSLGYHEVGRFNTHKAPTVPAGAQLAHGDWQLGPNWQGQL